jgi:hypothetical protein
MDGVAYYCTHDRQGIEQTITNNPGRLMGIEYAKCSGRRGVAPSESFTLYTSWLGLMGERREPNQRSSSRQSIQDRFSGVSYFEEGDRVFRACATGARSAPSFLGSRVVNGAPESFSLFTFWLGFDGLEDAKASDQTAESLTAEDQPQADPYILYCIG